MAAGLFRQAVKHQQSEHERARHLTGGGGDPVQREMGRDGVVDFDGLRSVIKAVQDPVTKCWTYSKGEDHLH